jgi:hypothetical protein
MDNKKNEKTKTLILLVISIAVSLIFAEGLVQVFYPQDLQKYDLDPDMVHTPRPNTVTRLSGLEFTVVRATNSKGLVDYEHNYTFDGFTIVMLGDSFTEASHVKLKEGFPKVIEQKLRDKYGKIRVVNCGIGNTGTDQQMIFLQKECIKYHPKIVMLNFYIGNDFANNYASLVTDYVNRSLVDKRPVKFSTFQRVFHFTNTRSHLVKLVENVFFSSDFIRDALFRMGLYKSLGEPYDNRISLNHIFFMENEVSDIGYDKTFLILDYLVEYSKSQNSTLIVTLIPTKEQVDENKFKEQFSIYENQNNSANMLKPNLALSAYLRKNGIMKIDLLPYFRSHNKNNTFYFEKDEHFNAKGHEQAAEVIYESLINSNLIS